MKKSRQKSLKKNNYEIIKTDVLIVGAGGAGLRAAIEAKKNGVDVLVVIKEPLGEAHTNLAMGGINVAIKPPATPKQHYEDTVNGGWHVNNHKLVDIFSKEMPDRIYDLESYGVSFDRAPDGSFYTWAGGKQSAPLNLCAGDYTGREMMQGLVKEVRKLKVSPLANHFVAAILKDKDMVIGALAIDRKTHKYKVISAKATIIAAGGAGQIYKINTNAKTNTGEGYAWGLDLGAELIDMEFVQFHPTGMAYPPKKKGVLVTEKVRGHGGTLKNKNGERFMMRYQPKRLELAGRDEITRAIIQEISEGRGTKHGAVYLDTTHWEKGLVEKIIPDVFAEHMEVGIDIRKQMMEISPSMHHMMGGFRINEWAETSIPGLFATGEISCSIHGANRLGGNSLGEGQVFGRRSGIRAAQFAKKHDYPEIPNALVDKEIKHIESFLGNKNGPTASQIIKSLKKIMWQNVGILRTEKQLLKAKLDIEKLQKRAKKLTAKTKGQIQSCLEAEAMLKTALAIIIPAILRKESRGAHYRIDYPQISKKWEKNIVIFKKLGKVKTKTVPVVRI